ncbi:hypothetical protein ABZY58_26140 [Micromonospora tulbaghiae]|uniref:hypothetical protein n=1 Tax=Micromonospora tulbaghiae TaxID=479978 RepID=UPI0033B799AE
MVHRLNDDELRAAAASRPGYATYPDFRPGQVERLGRLPSLHRAPACSHGYSTHVDRAGVTVHPDGLQCTNPRPWRSSLTDPAVENAAQVARAAIEHTGEVLDARPPTTDTPPPPATLTALPPAPVFDFQPRLAIERQWWQRRWHWGVIAADGGVYHGYAWTEAGARRRTARAARRAAR